MLLKQRAMIVKKYQKNSYRKFVAKVWLFFSEKFKTKIKYEKFQHVFLLYTPNNTIYSLLNHFQ